MYSVRVAPGLIIGAAHLFICVPDNALRNYTSTQVKGVRPVFCMYKYEHRCYVCSQFVRVDMTMYQYIYQASVYGFAKCLLADSRVEWSLAVQAMLLR
jgi:hypothetical protein